MEENKIIKEEEQQAEVNRNDLPTDSEPTVVDSEPVTEFLNDGFYSIDKEKQERLRRKREIRRLSNATALPLIGFDILGFVAVLVLEIILLLCVGTEQTNALFKDPDFNYLFNGVFSLLYFSLPFVLINKMTKTRLSETVAFGRCRFSKAISVIMLGFGVIAVTQYASAYLSSFLAEILGQPIQNPMPEYGTGTASFVINLVCVGLIPAVMEEFAFRGVILGASRKFMSDTMAIFINALLFSLLHGNLSQIPFTFALGLFLAYITVYTGSVVPAMIVHGVNNSMSVCISMLTAGMAGIVRTVVILGYYAVLAIIGILGLIVIINGNKEPMSLSKERSEDSKTVAAEYFTSAGFIIFAVIAAFKVLDVQFGITEIILKRLSQ